MLRKFKQTNNKSTGVLGVSGVWRTRKGKSDYFEYEVTYKNSFGKYKTKHFYVGVFSKIFYYKEIEMFRKACAFRAKYVKAVENNLVFETL